MIYIMQYWNKGSYWYPPEWWDCGRVTSRQVFSRLRKAERLLNTACRAIPANPLMKGAITLVGGKKRVPIISRKGRK
jgi:hypothetical protein